VIGAGAVRTAAIAHRVSAATRQTGAVAVGATTRVVRRSGGRATGVTRRGTRRAAAATRRAATHLVPDPVALPDQGGDRAARAERERVTVAASAEPEPVEVVARPAPASGTAATTTPSTAPVPSPGTGRRPPPRLRAEHGQVVPLRPRATTRLKATGELLVLVAVLGLVVSSIIVALAVAANQALNGL
jgi:hypothetical protein